MRRAALLLALGLVVVGCSNSSYDPTMCDFYQSLATGYTSSQGYVPADVQSSIAKYCTR